MSDEAVPETAATTIISVIGELIIIRESLRVRGYPVSVMALERCEKKLEGVVSYLRNEEGASESDAPMNPTAASGTGSDSVPTMAKGRVA